MLARTKMNTSILDDIKYSTIDIAEAEEPLTTVVGIKASDGIVLASDSQFTAMYRKDLKGSKIFPINKFIALGAAGIVSQMKILVAELKQNLGNNIYSDLDLRRKVEDTLLNLHKRYNLHWSESLGIPSMVFEPSSLLGAKLKDNSFNLYLLTFNPEPWVEPIDTYGTIGSGYLLARLVLKQHSRVASSHGKTLADLPLNYNIWVGSYVINEIKEFDTYTGGSTKVGVIRNEGFIEIPDSKVLEYYNQVVDAIPKAVSDALTKNKAATERMLKHQFPSG
jgi:20S proteasome alpha/beta subunit